MEARRSGVPRARLHRLPHLEGTGLVVGRDHAFPRSHSEQVAVLEAQAHPQMIHREVWQRRAAGQTISAIAREVRRRPRHLRETKVPVAEVAAAWRGSTVHRDHRPGAEVPPATGCWPSAAEKLAEERRHVSGKLQHT